jgi:signal transduction histidine kinase
MTDPPAHGPPFAGYQSEIFLLGMGGKTPEHPVSIVELERLVEQGYNSFAEEARRREIHYELSLGASPVLNTDGDRVLQIVSNLLSNAFSWTPDGGAISLAVSKDNGFASVSVTDSGPGIAPKDHDRVFRPFVSENGEGTGLGLAISLELAHALGGDLQLDSVVGRGSRFELRLPAR